MSKVLAALFTLAALGLLFLLLEEGKEESPVLLEGQTRVSGFSFTKPQFIAPPSEAAQGVGSLSTEHSGESASAESATQTDVEPKSTSAEGHSATAPATPVPAPVFDELVLEERQPSEACARIGPYQESRFQTIHQELERIHLRPRMLLLPAEAETKLRLSVGPFASEEALKKAMSDLDKVRVTYKTATVKGKKILNLGTFTNMHRAEVFLNSLQQKLPKLAVKEERETPEAGSPMYMTFLDMTSADFARLKDFAAKKNYKLNACPY